MVMRKSVGELVKVADDNRVYSPEFTIYNPDFYDMTAVQTRSPLMILYYSEPFWYVRSKIEDALRDADIPYAMKLADTMRFFRYKFDPDYLQKGNLGTLKELLRDGIPDVLSDDLTSRLVMRRRHGPMKPLQKARPLLKRSRAESGIIHKHTRNTSGNDGSNMCMQVTDPDIYTCGKR